MIIFLKKLLPYICLLIFFTDINAANYDAEIIQLKNGNKRFLNSTPIKRDSLALANYTATYGQNPRAIILGCIDSRSIPELVFDQGIGDVFVASVAGNVINTDMLASLEYATKVSGVQLIVILGHTQCGAVKAACEHVKLGNIEELLKKINPAVETVKAQSNKSDCHDNSLIDDIAKQNVLNQMQAILKGSEIIKSLVDSNKVKIVGAILDIKTGSVEWI